MAQLTAPWAQRQMLPCDQAKPLPRSCAAEATRTSCQALQGPVAEDAAVIGRQVGEGVPQYRSALRGAASRLPLAWHYRDTGSCLTAAPEIQRESSGGS